VVLVGGVAFLRTVFPPAVTLKGIVKKYEQNQKDVDIVIDYLKDIECEFATIFGSDEGVRNIHIYTGVLPVTTRNFDNAAVSEAINRLLDKNGCHLIHKSDGAVWFQFWATLDSGRGIVYTIGDVLPQTDSTDGRHYIFESLGVPKLYFYIDNPIKK
jgi:hypothetical protein